MRTQDKSITGVFINAAGVKIANIHGTSYAPNQMQLEFSSPGLASHSTVVRYRLITDNYDTAEDIRSFDTTLQRIDPSADAPKLLNRCNNACTLWPGQDRLAGNFYNWIGWRAFAFTRPGIGLLCVDADRVHIQEIMKYFTNEGLPVRLTHSPNCQELSFKVPEGLERWAIAKMMKAPGVRSVDYTYGPSGGSGEVRDVVQDGTFLPTDLQPATIKDAWNRGACKIKNIFQPEFRSVSVSPCKPIDGFDTVEACFSVTLEGHTADPRGVSSANLGRILDDRFLVRTEIIFEIMAVKYDRSPTKYVEPVVYNVNESKFARQPPDVSADRATFHDIEHFHIGKSNRQVDNAIVAVAQQLILSHDFVCKNSPETSTK
jgi:hypothetical protein